jgi:hypothetical protein
MPETVKTFTRKPAPNPTRPGKPPVRPNRPANVAKGDNQFAQEEKPRGDITRKSDTVLHMAAVEPIKAAKRCQAEISAMNSGFQKEKRRLIADAYAIACGLENNPQAWGKFLEDPFWNARKKKPTIDDRAEPLLHVMVFVFKAIDSIDRNIYKRAAKYAAALKRYWADDVPPREVAAKIKEDGGIEALCKAPTANKPKKKAEPEQSLKLLPDSEALRKKLLALSEGQKARLIIERVTAERGVVATIIGFHPSNT